MKIPSTFLPGQERLGNKLKDLMERENEKDGKKGLHLLADDIPGLETLKKGETRKEQEAFLKLLAKHIPGLVRRIRTEMEQTDKRRIYLDNPKDYKNRDYGYRTRLEIGIEGHLKFHHSISGNTYVADLDDDYYGDFWPIHEYINTYPNKKNSYSYYSEDFLSDYFKIGKEVYESIVLFLRENKNL